MEVNLTIEDKDIAVVKNYLKGKEEPVQLSEVNYQVALYKTQDKRKNRVKVYNPNCEYKVGDLIYKEYAGKLPIGAKKSIDMGRGVVLKVEEVKVSAGYHEIKLAYEGTSDFRKYTDYLERQKIELLLPHKQSKPCEKHEYLSEEDDPRTQQPPMVERDLNKLQKKLKSALQKEQKIAYISDKVLLEENLKKIDDDVFDRIRDFLTENKKSESTEFMVENFLKINADDPQFDSFCFSLNYIMSRDYKIDFQQTYLKGWGKWNLISVIYYLKKDSIISITNPLKNKIYLHDKKNLAQRRKKFEDTLFGEEYTRYFLTQREVTAGALRLRPGVYDFGESIEIEATEVNTKKDYTIYYYSDENLLLGFKECFDGFKALQGMILTLDQVGENKFIFNVRTTKKGTVSDKVEFDSKKEIFLATEEKVASPVFLNKSMFLESDIFEGIQDNIPEFKKMETFNKLVHKVFLEFGVKEKNYEIHILRLYHIIDLIYPTDFRLVTDVILCNPEFIPSDKIPGVYYLDSDAVVEIEEEELKRRRQVVEESKKKREQARQKKLEEEQKLKDEIRMKREERRRKREEEMRLKDKMTGGDTLPVDVPHQEEEIPVAEGIATDIPRPAAEDEDSESKKDSHKKSRKKSAGDRAAKPKKRTERKVSEDNIDMEEIKDDILLEELKEEVLDKKEKEKKAEKEKEVAYKDEGGFGGILGSKLDQVVKPDEDEEDDQEE
jgi:hypothetical protein